MTIKRLGGGFGLDKAQKEFNAFKLNAPKAVANNSKNWFLEGFRKDGFQTDASKTGWEPRKPNTKRNTGRGILVDTGALRRSIQVLSQSWSKIVIGTQRIPYADRHNDGLSGMPQRQFIGDSKEMNKSNQKLLAKMVGGIFS